MKVAILGASGRTGIPLVQQALEAGYEVVALVRDPAKLPLKHEHLTVIQGDALDPVSVEKTIQGTDAVLNALGPVKGSPANLMTTVTGNILSAMQKYGVRRLVALTGAGVAAPQDRPKLPNHLIKFALKTLAGNVLRDAEQQAELLRTSDRDWVLVRGPMLNEGPHTGKYRVGWVGVNTGVRVSRADLADFMLKQVTDTTYLRQAPMVSD